MIDKTNLFMCSIPFPCSRCCGKPLVGITGSRSSHGFHSKKTPDANTDDVCYFGVSGVVLAGATERLPTQMGGMF